MITKQEVLQAYRIARKSRKDHFEVYDFDVKLIENIGDMYSELKNRTFEHGKYRRLVIHDSKKRIIYSPHFRDHVFHHIIYKRIYAPLDTKMVYSSFACRLGFGALKGIKYLRKKILQEQKKCGSEELYYLKIDFSKYFFSIHHSLLLQKLGKYIHDEETLYFLKLLIDSYASENSYDSLLSGSSFYAKEKKKGLPIGGVVSQILANFFLNDIDQELKHSEKVSFIRYMDDIVVLGNKQKLKKVKEMMCTMSLKDKLIIHPHKVAFNKAVDGVKFIGYSIKYKKGYWRIHVGKRMILGLNRMINDFSNLNLDNISTIEKRKVDSIFHSRIGAFKNIGQHGKVYIKGLHGIPSWWEC